MESEGGEVLLKVRSRRFEMRSVEPSVCQVLETWNDWFCEKGRLRSSGNRKSGAMANAKQDGKESSTYTDSYLGSHTS